MNDVLCSSSLFFAVISCMSNAVLISAPQKAKNKQDHLYRWGSKNEYLSLDPAIIAIGLDNWPKWDHELPTSRNLGCKGQSQEDWGPWNSGVFKSSLGSL